MTVDTDYDGWTLGDGRWDAARMSGLLARESDVVVAGTVDNQGDFYDCFDHVVLLSAPLEVLIGRVSSRTTNPYGRTAAEQAEIVRYVQTVEPLLRKTASVELDGQAGASELARAVEALIEQPALGRLELCCCYHRRSANEPTINHRLVLAHQGGQPGSARGEDRMDPWRARQPTSPRRLQTPRPVRGC